MSDKSTNCWPKQGLPHSQDTRYLLEFFMWGRWVIFYQRHLDSKSSFVSFSPWATPSQNSVGEDWRRGHGCQATWMITVQRGMKWHASMCNNNEKPAVTWRVNFNSCYLDLPVLPSLGGRWAVLSEVPAAGPWSPSICRGEGKHWQGAGRLQEVLLWEGLPRSEGLLLCRILSYVVWSYQVTI